MTEDREQSPPAQESPEDGQAPRSLWPRRAIIRSLLAAPGAVAALYAGVGPAAAAERLASIPVSARESAMRRAMAVARGNPAYPFGAVITRIADGHVMAEGVNASKHNPMHHGEVAAMENYLHRHGNRDWPDMVLYTTAEPCAMCMSALVWAGIGGVVFGTSLAGLKRAGIDQIDIPAATIVAASPFWHGEVLGGVLESETDRLFAAGRRG